MKKTLVFFLLFSLAGLCAAAREYHVSPKGSDANDGSLQAPFETIGRAARQAGPGDIVTVHAGTYREWVNPPRGGESDDRRIVYRAAPGERAEIKGSERITGWVREKGRKGVWKVVLPDTFFGDYNPYTDPVAGDWFDGRGRIHHTGEVFLNEKSLYEQETLEKVFEPAPDSTLFDPEGASYVWYCAKAGDSTVIWANFHAFNPNRELVEISVRRTCFYPDKPGVDYITLDGFYISQAATQWAAPTAEQIGIVATHWNKGWIIENNVIRNSKCSGITLGKERKTGHNVWSADRGRDGSLHYIEVTFNAIRAGWNRANVGSHIVRNNVISDCEQTGMCGSMGAAFSVIENNHIYNIWTKRQFDGAEIGGIKFHAAVDTRICGNRIHTCGRGVWLDWMTQGTRVSGNLLYDNDLEDIFLEVNHGPFLIDNNILASATNIREQSQGGAYVHNLLLGKIHRFAEHTRYTPYFLPHSTEVAGLSIIPGGDDRYCNNLFAPAAAPGAADIRGFYGLSGYEKTAYPMYAGGNLYYGSALPLPGESGSAAFPDFSAGAQIVEKADGVYLLFDGKGFGSVTPRIVDTQSLGKAKLPRQAFEEPDGTPLAVAVDYLGMPRGDTPRCGPLESLGEGSWQIRVWPRQ